MNRCVASVGTFDGLHIGHKAVIDRVLAEAAARGLDSRIITFINHPLSVIAPDRAPLWATSRGHSIDLIYNTGITRVSELNFTPELAALTAADFMRLIHSRYAVDVLVMGPDNSFGSDRLAGRDEYVAVGRGEGVEVIFVDDVTGPDGQRPSSSRLRQLVAEGNLTEYDNLTGSMITLSGTVVRGKRNGTRLGFPTANIRVEGQQPPKEGVYTGWLIFDDEDSDSFSGHYFGLLNVGRNPTFGADNPVTYEFHIPGDRLGDLYGEHVTVYLMGYLRPDRQFSSSDELKRTIRGDIDCLAHALCYLIHDNESFFDCLSVANVRFITRYLKKKPGRR